MTERMSSPKWREEQEKKVKAAKLVLPDYEKKRDERRKVAKRVLENHFPDAKSYDHWAFLLASGIATWGETVPTLTYAQKAQLDKTAKELEKLLKIAPYWLAKPELKITQEILNAGQSAHLLYGRQNTNEMADKVQLVDVCRQIWKGYHKKEAPVSYQQETNPFSEFVSEVAAKVFEKDENDWSPKSVIQAFENYQENKNK